MPGSYTEPDWDHETRFFLPNEDAEVVRQALEALPRKVEEAVFITGSGFLALDILPSLAQELHLECIDRSPFQRDYCLNLIRILGFAASPEDILNFVHEQIVPKINAYYGERGQSYSHEGIEKALHELFRIRFLKDQTWLNQVKVRLKRVQVTCANAVDAVASRSRLDFIHLSNIIDYLDQESLQRLFQALRKHAAFVFAIETSACRNSEQLAELFSAYGFQEDESSPRLQSMNRALGCSHSTRPWMRTGRVHLLIPA